VPWAWRWLGVSDEQIAALIGRDAQAPRATGRGKIVADVGTRSAITLVFAACALAVGVFAASWVQARPIHRGTIIVGRGAAGARLDMTRHQVVAKLGRPVAANGEGVMSYERPARGIFDIYRYADSKRVRMIIVASHGRAWRLRDGNAIFAKAAIDRLYQRYGHRVHRVRDPRTGDAYYVIRSIYHHRPVETKFEVNRFSRKRALVRNLFILFTDRTP
jgi:hypothetical protein